MCDKIVYILVPGILTFPGESDNWNGRGVTWLIKRMKFAEKIEYFSGPLFSRSRLQKRRERKLVKTLTHYYAADFKIILAGHSNGADVILDALGTLGWPPVEALHLFSPACEADFDKRGLNQSNIGRLVIYIAGNDLPVRFAETWFGEKLGYGKDILGYCGPINAKIPHEIVRESDFGHSDWFRDEVFDQTMEMVTG